MERPKTNGFVDRFNGPVLDEILMPAFRRKFYGATEELQEDPKKRLKYHPERSHPGYSNMGNARSTPSTNPARKPTEHR